MTVIRRLWHGQTGADTVIQQVLLSYAGHLRNDPAVARDDELWRLLFRIALRHLDNANHRTARWRKATGARALFRHPGPADGGFDPADPAPGFLAEVDGSATSNSASPGGWGRSRSPGPTRTPRRAAGWSPTTSSS